jgi:hypothetical protein
MDESKKRNDELTAQLRRLQDALWHDAEDAMTHNECRAALPQFVEEEAAGVEVSSKYPRIQRHLDHCPDCGEEYAMMLDLALAEVRGELDFGESSNEDALLPYSVRLTELQTTVLGWARDLIRILVPAEAERIDGIAAVWFGLRQARQVNESHSPYGVERGAAHELSALGVLAASYAATQAFCAEVTAQQFDRWSTEGVLIADLRRRAEQSARDVGFREEKVREFAESYAERVGKDMQGMRRLLRDD